ncbi:MAG: HEAT repeat domain-containing protein, partial [Anaerolineales bacterium]
MKKSVIRRILSALKIQAGEVQQVLLVCAFALLPSVGGAIGSPGIEALFFARFGVQFLPYMYIALGVITMVSTLTLTAALSRIPKSRLFRSLPLIMAGLLLIARLLVAMDLSASYPVLWLGMYLFWTLQALLIWGVAGMLFNTRQAKRIFPLFAASAIAGNALGGLFTGPLVAWLGTENLLLVWAIMLVFTFFFAVQLTSAYDPPRVHYYRPKPGIRETLEGGGKSVFRSPTLSWLSISMLLLAIFLYALAFPFSKAVALQFPAEDALAGFLGVFQGVTTAVAMLISLALVNRLFARVGFLGALLIFALIYMLGFGGLIFSTSFVVLAVFRFAQQAWMMGVADTAYQATFNMVPPGKREPARMFVDGIPKQIGVALSGVFLLTLQPMVPDPLQFAAFAILASFCVLTLRQARLAFSRSLADVLDQRQMHIFEHEPASFSEFAHDGRAFEVLISGLESDNFAVRQTVVEILGRLGSVNARKELKRAMNDPSAQIRMLASRVLLNSSRGPVKKEYLLIALRDRSVEVRCEGLRAIDKELSEDLNVQQQLKKLLMDLSSEVRALAAALLLKFEHFPEARIVLVDMMQSDEVEVRISVMNALQVWGSQTANNLATMGVEDDNPVVRSRALQALVVIDPDHSLEPIKAALGDPEKLVQTSAAKVLTEIGPAAVPTVLEALFDPNLEAGALLALEELPPAGTRDVLLDYIQARVDNAHKLDSYCKKLLVTQADTPRLQLLHDSLRERVRRNILRALSAFRLISNRDRVELAIAGLQSQDDDQRANALELLEAIDERQLIESALDLWESDLLMLDPEDPEYLELRRTETILELLKSDDTWLRACAAFAVNAGEQPKIRTGLEALSKSDPDLLVRETATEGLNSEDTMESITTLPIMERILFLREVPLFSELTPEELKQVAAIAGEHIFKEGETFVTEGELGDEMYIIVSGKVRVLSG